MLELRLHLQQDLLGSVELKTEKTRPFYRQDLRRDDEQEYHNSHCRKEQLQPDKLQKRWQVHLHRKFT